MELALGVVAGALMDGQDPFATNESVINDARTMVNVRMELVYASLAGMENTVPWKDVQIAAVVMASVKPTLKVSGSVNVTKAGLVLSAVS